MKKLIVLFSLISLVTHASEEVTYNCSSAKEYITTYNFLKDQKHLELPDTQIEKVALEVSKGCNEAAQRFIETFQVLVKSEAGSRAAIQYAIKLAKLSNNYQNVFLDIFVSAFSKDQLDLDLSTSLSLASRLSIDFQGEIKTVKSDFRELTKFCLSKNLGLSLAQCGELSKKVILHSEVYKKPVAKAFIEAYNYLTTNKKITMDKNSAIQQSEHLVSLSPKAFENFKMAFEFQQKKHTLDESLKFANQIADYTVFNKKTRLPASQDQKDQ